MKLFFIVFLVTSISTSSFGQLVVDGKNLNEDKNVEYIQFSFYYEGKQLTPVYLIDYGTVMKDDQQQTPQKISIDKEEITSRMTPALVMNKLYKSGWEYMGDLVFMKVPLVENSHMYTFRRRKN